MNVAPALSAPVSTRKYKRLYKQRFEAVTFNFGSHTEFFNDVQDDTKGGMRKFEWGPTIGIGASLPLIQSLRFLPEVNWVLPKDNGEEWKIIQNIFMFRADLGYDPLEWLRLRLGTSLMVLNQHGQGGTTKMDNGNDQSNFYYPEENRSSINNTFDLGIEAMYEEYSVRLQTYTYSLLEKESRQVSYTLFLTYYWQM